MLAVDYREKDPTLRVTYSFYLILLLIFIGVGFFVMIALGWYLYFLGIFQPTSKKLTPIYIDRSAIIEIPKDVDFASPSAK